MLLQPCGCHLCPPRLLSVPAGKERPPSNPCAALSPAPGTSDSSPFCICFRVVCVLFPQVSPLWLLPPSLTTLPFPESPTTLVLLNPKALTKPTSLLLRRPRPPFPRLKLPGLSS